LRRTKGTTLTASVFRPGPVGSDFYGENSVLGKIVRSPIGKALMISSEGGAEPLVYLATVADAESVSGAYFHRMKRREPKGTSPELAARL
jgi:hypothetical protein